MRPAGAPPISPEYRARIEAGRPRLYAIAREHYGLELNPGPFGFDSRPALIGAKYAEAMGRGPAYHAAVMRAYWLEGKALDDPQVLLDIATQVGLEPAEFRAALADPVWEGAMLADIAEAQAYGLNAVPALVFVEKYLVSGAQPYAVLTQVVEQVQQY